MVNGKYSCSEYIQLRCYCWLVNLELQGDKVCIISSNRVNGVYVIWELIKN